MGEASSLIVSAVYTASESFDSESDDTSALQIIISSDDED